MSLFTHILKRNTAMLVCATIATTYIQADNSDALSEQWLLTHNFYVAAATGPWISNPHVPYNCDYDYSYGGGYFEKDNDQLMLRNFYISGLDIPASLDVDNKILTLDISGPLKTSDLSMDYPNCTVEIYTCDMPTTTQTDDTPSYLAEFKVREQQPGTIEIPLDKGDDHGTYWGQYWSDQAYNNLIQNNAWVFVVKDSDGNVKRYIPMMYPRFESVVEHDATAYDYIGDKIVRKYKVDVIFNHTAFDLLNYNALGLNNSYSFQCHNTRSVQIATGLAYQDNTFTFKPKDNMQRRDYLQQFQGETLTDDSQQPTAFQFAYTGAAEMRTYRVCSYEGDGTINGEVINEMDQALHNTDATQCPWVTNGGGRQTLTTLLVEFGKNGLQDQTTGEFVEKLDRTIIEWDNYDYTLDVSLNIYNMYYSNGRYCINGMISPNSNTLFVDHYELCMVPKERITLTTDDSESKISTQETLNANNEPYDNGFENATNISIALSQAANRSPRRSYYAEDMTSYDFRPTESTYFNVEISQNDIDKLSSNGQYAVYIKAIYNSESGLTPTYHSLQTPITSGVVSGIDDVSAAVDATPIAISTSNGSLQIRGTFGNVKVYTTMGELIYNGSDATISLAPGLYILDIDGHPYKALIR
jgi:hypothetical protein